MSHVDLTKKLHSQYLWRARNIVSGLHRSINKKGEQTEKPMYLSATFVLPPAVAESIFQPFESFILPV